MNPDRKVRNLRSAGDEDSDTISIIDGCLLVMV